MSCSAMSPISPTFENHPANAQMNVRIERSLRDSGSAALAEIGLSPSNAIRALWGKAAKGGADLKEVAELLTPKASTNAHADMFDTLEMSRQAVADLLQTMRAAPYVAESDTRSYEELKAAAYQEQLLEEAGRDE